LLELASGKIFPSPDTLDLDLKPALNDAAAHLLPDGPDYVGLAPGSGGPTKCWPLENFIALARHQAAKGRVPVFLLGPMEIDWWEQIKTVAPGALFPLQGDAVQAAFGFSPALTIAVSKRFAASVSNDSGSGHMFAVGGKPIVFIYGVTAPKKFQPMTKALTIIRAQDFGGREMHTIPVDAVEAALEAVL